MKKIFCILVFIILMITTSAVASQSIIKNQQNETIPNEPLPIEKVKEIPVPWLFWEPGLGGGIRNIIFFLEEVKNPVAIVRDYIIIDKEIKLDDLTWVGTSDLDWNPIDQSMDPYILNPGEEVESFIPTTKYDKAVLVRYTVAWASSPDIIETHFVNEAILENSIIIGSLSNFDVHNNYDKPINNFELELYGYNGEFNTNDVLDVYDPPGDPYKSGNIWYGGWGSPSQINDQSYGVEITWMDKKYSVQPYDWFHCGVSLKPNVLLIGARGHLSITTNKDIIDILEVTKFKNNILPNSLFLNFLQHHKFVHNFKTIITKIRTMILVNTFLF